MAWGREAGPWLGDCFELWPAREACRLWPDRADGAGKRRPDLPDRQAGTPGRFQGASPAA